MTPGRRSLARKTTVAPPHQQARCHAECSEDEAVKTRIEPVATGYQDIVMKLISLFAAAMIAATPRHGPLQMCRRPGRRLPELGRATGARFLSNNAWRLPGHGPARTAPRRATCRTS